MPKYITQALSLSELHRIKAWHVEHALDHPVEYQLWDAVLTSWFMGWIGWLPTWVLDAWWAGAPCLLGMAAPRLYVGWRARAHARNRLRCDWIQTPAKLH
jgi:hypothetical protein